MPWFRSRPPGASRSKTRVKYSSRRASPTCSNIPIDETASLHARHHQARQIELLRRAGTGQPGRPDADMTEEVASLRALERSPAPDGAPHAASDGPTEDMRSLRALERSSASAGAPHAAPDVATEDMRSLRSLERLGFVREGVLVGWHVHGEQRLDVAILRLLREDWERGELAAVPVALEGELPPRISARNQARN